MFDAVVGIIAFQGYLNQSVNGNSDTEVEIKGNSELAMKVWLERYAMHITKCFHK
jgi:hypothetical protein